MANHKSARKRAKQNEVRRERNKMKTSKVRTLVKKLRDAITQKNSEVATKLMPSVQSAITKLGRSKVSTNQTSSRKISRLADQVNKISAQ